MLRSSASRLSTRISVKPILPALTSAHYRPCTLLPIVQRPPSSLYNQHRRQYSAFASRSSSLSKTCPSCSAPLPTPLPACPRCSYIAPLPPSVTYYDIMGISSSHKPFDVDTSLLKDRFRDLQRVVHPDKWSGKEAGAQDLAAGMSGIVNRAYGTLTNPYTRAEYILQLQGVTIGESDNVDDTALIMEVMESREELDNAETREEVDRIRRDNLVKINELLPTLSAAIDAKDWSAAKDATIKLKYLQSIDSAAEAWPNQPFDH